MALDTSSLDQFLGVLIRRVSSGVSPTISKRTGSASGYLSGICSAARNS